MALFYAKVSKKRNEDFLLKNRYMFLKLENTQLVKNWAN